MKVAITGHTKGIGLSISEEFFNNGYETIGFSRSTGFRLPDDIIKVVRASNDCDVFINNAYIYHDDTQIRLLYLMYDCWKDQNKTIVNISSRAGDFSSLFKVDKYSTYKAALDTASKQLSEIKNPKCRVINIKPGWVDTESVSKLSCKKLNPKDVAKTVVWAVKQPKDVYITSISMRPFD